MADRDIPYGPFSGGGLVIPLKGPVIIINGNRMVSTRKEEFENGNWKEQHFPYHYYETDNFDVQAINRIMDGKNRIGTIHGERMRVSLYDFLTEKLKGFSFEDVTLEIEKIKAMKSEEELRVMSELSRMADRIFAGAESIIEAGYNMQEIAVALRKALMDWDAMEMIMEFRQGFIYQQSRTEKRRGRYFHRADLQREIVWI